MKWNEAISLYFLGSRNEITRHFITLDSIDIKNEKGYFVWSASFVASGLNMIMIKDQNKSCFVHNGPAYYIQTTLNLIYDDQDKGLDPWDSSSFQIIYALPNSNELDNERHKYTYININSNDIE